MSAPAEQSEKDGQDRQTNDAQQRVASSADTWPTVLLLPAMLLLRYLGEHSWAYWTGAVLGLLGTIGAAVEITGAVGHLAHRRRPLVAFWVLFCLVPAVVLVGIRLVEQW
ncbi:hypothetical protein ABZ532_17250 [Streptomyces sp. NPDC019396]|uniref:hypothetical protein n=1 Tax=Streptomyces sp. NPDC019396 TaxID=3154687 RepID=UPI0033E098B1